MNKLSNPPLLEVIFEIKWNIESREDIQDMNYLHGDLFSELKKKYSFRESVHPGISPDLLINLPVYRFRESENGYPLIQVGPGILTVNTSGQKYLWDVFYKQVESLSKSTLKVYPKIGGKKILLNLTYIDFFPFNFKNDNVIAFLNENFRVKYEQNFFESKELPSNLNLGFYYNTSVGNLTLAFRKGLDNNSNEGVIMQTTVNGYPLDFTMKKINAWVQESHKLTSDLFKNILTDELYHSFK